MAVETVAASVESRAAPSSASRRRKEQLLGLLFIAPAVLFMACFFLLPLAMTGWMSLHNWPLIGTPKFTGFANFVTMWKDQRFWRALGFTVSFAAVVTITTLLVAFPLALLVQKNRPGVSLYRAMFFLPVVIGMASASLLWYWLCNVDAGILTPILRWLGLITEPVDVLATFPSAFASIVVMVTWKTAGFSMILLMAGLQSIPSEVYQAALVDGANRIDRFFRITLPLMRRSIALTLVLCIAGAMLAFDPFYIILNGGPANQTVTSVYWIFSQSFVSFKLGYGAALSIVLLGILLAVSALQLRILRPHDGDDQ